MVNPNGSEAYDLSLFEPREPKLVALKPNKKAVKEARRRARIQSFLNTALTLLTAAAVVAVVGLLISSRVRLTELNSEKKPQGGGAQPGHQRNQAPGKRAGGPYLRQKRGGIREGQRHAENGAGANRLYYGGGRRRRYRRGWD